MKVFHFSFIKYAGPIVFLFMFIHCRQQKQYPPGIRATLSKAGHNRGEIEKVLNHYSIENRDSLKLKAAYYLIENMAESFYWKSDVFETYSAVFKALAAYDGQWKSSDHSKNKEIRRLKFEELWRKHEAIYGPPGQSVFKPYTDVENISAQMLIENIDYAFKAWEFPWSRAYSFEQFCKYILPYRSSDEPLELWRAHYFKKISPAVDSLRHQTDPLIVAKAINDWLSLDYSWSNYLEGFNRGSLKPTDLLDGRITPSCGDQVLLGNSVFRAMGIASSRILIPTWATYSYGHQLTSILDKSGNWFYVEAGDGQIHAPTTRLNTPKSYLQTFSGPYPDLLQNPNGPSFSYLNDFSDVTDQLNKVIDIPIELSGNRTDSYLYLHSFSQPKWVPLYFAPISNNRAIFKKMGVNMVYLPGYNDKAGSIVPASPPIWVDSTGRITKLVPGDSSFQFSFLRKFKPGGPNKVKRSEALKGGRFQIAAKEDFSDAVDIYTIGSFVSYHPQQIAIPAVMTRYVRYVFPPAEKGFKDGPSQLAFYGKNGDTLKKLTGVFLSSEGASRRNIERLFDDDLLTYVRYTIAEPGLETDSDDIMVGKNTDSLLWVGLDLGQIQTITHVEFCPRNDKNEVYKGNRYELFYWDNQWKSMGSKVAIDTLVTYEKIPAGALLWLRNLTEGKEERIFTIQNNNIRWH